MHDVKKLLVPIDFSQESAKALMYASSLAKQLNAELIALHVVEDITEEESLLSFVFPPEGWPFLMRNRDSVRWMFCSENGPSTFGISSIERFATEAQ